jgi:hypothetical protein
LCKEPLLNEPGVTKSHADFINYTKIIEYKNVDIAILKMMDKTIGVYPEKFGVFYPTMKENFNKNSESIIKYLENKCTEEPKEVILTTAMYNMNVKVNYPELLTKYRLMSTLFQ